MKTFLVQLGLASMASGIIGILLSAAALANPALEAKGYYWDVDPNGKNQLLVATPARHATPVAIGNCPLTASQTFKVLKQDDAKRCLQDAEATTAQLEVVSTSGDKEKYLPQDTDVAQDGTRSNLYVQLKYTGQPGYPDGPEFICHTEKSANADTYDGSVKACWEVSLKMQSKAFEFSGFGEGDRLIYETGGSRISINNDLYRVRFWVTGDSRCVVTASADKGKWYDNLQNLNLWNNQDDQLKKVFDPSLLTFTDDCNAANAQKINGTRGVSINESVVRKELQAQKESLKNKYRQICQDRERQSGGNLANCVSANDAFETLWTACVVITGDPSGDVSSAKNCLKNHAGVDLDDGVILSKIPPEPTTDVPSSCSVDMIGYIICPVMRFMAGAADMMFSTMQRLLHISPLDRDEQAGQGAYRAWSALRDIANVIFVIGLLAAVISQITGYGITNYGLKKFIPKLIVASILVNVSFLICVLALDIANVLGDSIHSILLGINQSLPNGGTYITANMGGQNVAGGESAALTWTVMIGAGLVGAGAVLAIVLLFVPILTVVLLALLTVVLLLITRHAMIIILTVLAPIAIVLYMLPNLRKWFSKWRSFYLTLLMMYPVVAIIFGLSTIAANVVLQIGSAANSTSLRLFALAIQAIPLFVTPIILKLGGQALGTAARAIKNNGLMKGTRAKADRLQQTLGKQRKLRALKGGRGPIAALYRRQASKEAVRSIRKGELSNASAAYISRYLNAEEGSGGEKTGALQRAKGVLPEATRNRFPGLAPKNKGEAMLSQMAAGSDADGHDRALAYALNASHKITAKEVEAAKAIFTENYSEAHRVFNDLHSGSTVHSEASQLAAIEVAGQFDDSEGLALAAQASGKLSAEGRSALVAAYRTSPTTGGVMSHPAAVQALLSGEVTPANYGQKVIAPALNDGYITAENIAGMEEASLLEVERALDNNQISGSGKQNLLRAITDARTNDKVSKDIDSQASIVLGRLETKAR